MKRHLAMLAVVFLAAVPLWAEGKKTPENPSLILLAVGSAGVLWRYIKNKV